MDALQPFQVGGTSPDRLRSWGQQGEEGGIRFSQDIEGENFKRERETGEGKPAGTKIRRKISLHGM